jgi:hypothetical protein
MHRTKGSNNAVDPRHLSRGSRSRERERDIRQMKIRCEEELEDRSERRSIFRARRGK